MNLTIGTSQSLSKSQVVNMAAYRNRVFVQKLGWQLQCQDGLEYDQFDRADTVYVIAADEQGEVVGTARLLPTLQPYLLEKIFPELMGEHALPRSSEVWELSRFAAMNLSAAATTSSVARQFSSPVAVGLLRESLRCAASLGAKRLITVSPMGIERLLERNGFSARRAASPVMLGGSQLFACWIDCE